VKQEQQQNMSSSEAQSSIKVGAIGKHGATTKHNE
jgi:hypothetical protein